MCLPLWWASSHATGNLYWTIPFVGQAGDGLGCPSDGLVVLAKAQRVPRHLAQDEAAI